MANQAWQIASPGKIRLENIGPIPKPGSKEALVRVHAISLNYRDKLIVEQSPHYPLKSKENLIPAGDGAGVIEETGPHSTWKKGDRVIIQPSDWKCGNDDRDFKFKSTLGGGDVDGTLRKWMVVSDGMLLKAPNVSSLEEAASMYTAGVTAYRALYYGGVRLQPGMKVLTQGTGGVSCYAIMIAAAAGAEVIATSSSDEKLEVARKLGAKHLINYRTTPEWSSKVMEYTDGKGVDIAVDVVGADSIEQTLKSTAFAGLVCVVGMLSSDPNKPASIMQDILFGAKTVRGQLGAGSREIGIELATFIEKHELHPPIAETFEFEQADKALEALTTLTKPGKIVIRG